MRWVVLLFPLLGILSSVVSPAAQSVVSADARPATAPPGKLVDIGGYRLHLNCTGKGEPTVVLIPGSGDFSFDWSLVQPGVSRLTRVCSYDLAGFAWSDPGPTPRTMRQEASEARAKQTFPLGDRPLVVLLPKLEYGNPPFDLLVEEWKRIVDEKRQQKLDFAKLSRNSKVIIAENSGHHIQLDEPQVVIDAIHTISNAVKPRN